MSVEEEYCSEEDEYFYEEYHKSDDYETYQYCLFCQEQFLSYKECSFHEEYCKQSPYCSICYRYGHNQKNCPA